MSQSKIDEAGLQDMQEKAAALMSAIEVWVLKTNPNGEDVIPLMATIMDCMIRAFTLDGLIASGEVKIADGEHALAKERVKTFFMVALSEVLKGVLPNA